MSAPARPPDYEQRLVMVTLLIIGGVVILALAATVVLLVTDKDASAVTPLVAGGMGILSRSPVETKGNVKASVVMPAPCATCGSTDHRTEDHPGGRP